MRGGGVRFGLALLAGAMAAAGGGSAAAALEVVVTIKPLHALVARVMAGAGTPELLVQGAQSAHTYALKPSDLSKLNRADVFVRMSDSMEPFTARVIKSLPGSVQVLTLQETKGLRLLERRTRATFGDDKQGHSPEHDHGQDHEHAHGGGQDRVDGHAWLDPVNAKLMADRIAAVLGAKAPAEAATFRANAEAFKAELDALSAELARELAPVAGKPYIVFHDALQYFELRFGLSPAGSIAISPEVPPSARRLSALRQLVMTRGAACVLVEPQFDRRLADNLVEGTPARIGTIDPEGSRIEPGPELYTALLRNLARDLKACLAP